jgi:hypothetical protein
VEGTGEWAWAWACACGLVSEGVRECVSKCGGDSVEVLTGSAVLWCVRGGDTPIMDGWWSTSPLPSLFPRPLSVAGEVSEREREQV